MTPPIPTFTADTPAPDDHIIRECLKLCQDYFTRTGMLDSVNIVNWAGQALERMVTAAQQNAEIGGWRTISSAPLNTDIIIYGTVPQFIGKRHQSGERFYYSLTGSDCQSGCGNTGFPTHWQSLPAPPISEQPKQD